MSATTSVGRRDWSRPETHAERIQRRIDEVGVDAALGLIRRQHNSEGVK